MLNSDRRKIANFFLIGARGLHSAALVTEDASGHIQRTKIK